MILPAAIAAEVNPPLLDRASTAARKYLTTVPDYVCRVDIERFERPGKRGKFLRRDHLKLEVAYVGGRELYGMPGQEKFDDGPIDRMTGGRGAMSTGSFAMHLRELFQTDHALPEEARVVKEQGREVVKLEFSVPRNRSGVTIFDGYHREFVGYHASMRMTPGSFDPEWLEVEFSDIPKVVRVAHSVETTAYKRVRIADRDVALPESSKLELTTSEGRTLRNEVRFSNCRRYGVEATVSFEDTSVVEKKAPEPLAVSAGAEVEAVLEEAIDESTAIGDTVVFRVTNGRGIPPGAKLTGHVTRLARREIPGVTSFLIGVRIEKVEAAGRAAKISADLMQMTDPLSQHSRTEYRVSGLEDEALLAATGRGFPVRVGVRWLWRVR